MFAHLEIKQGTVPFLFYSINFTKMDACNTAQDVHRCNLCGTVIVHSYCDFYHVNLYTPCIGKHISDFNIKFVNYSAKIATSVFVLPVLHQYSTNA